MGLDSNSTTDETAGPLPAGKIPPNVTLSFKAQNLMLRPITPRQLMTAEEFLIWAEAQPREAGKFELWDGEVIMTRGPVDGPLELQSERSQHWEAKGIIYRAFHDAIKQAKLPCHAVVDGASVKLATLGQTAKGKDRVVEPDVLVYCGPKAPRDALSVPNPMIVVEVLSPGTAAFVSAAKLDAYFKHPSIQHYLMVDTDKPLVIHHRRTTDNVGDSAGSDAWMTRIVNSGRLQLNPPGLDVDLTELFELAVEG
jgi:Uma2 family endonuclease